MSNLIEPTCTTFDYSLAPIDSVNETIQSINAAAEKYKDQEHIVSLVTFHDDVKTVYECVPIKEVEELTSETYQPKCCTALYDAMGMSLNALRPKVAEADKVLVTVVTDGYENASKEYSGKAIKALVDELKTKGWVFAYIGANQDVETVAATISITNVLNFEATHIGTACMSLLDALHRATLINDNEIENSCLHSSVIIKLFLFDTMLARQLTQPSHRV